MIICVCVCVCVCAWISSSAPTSSQLGRCVGHCMCVCLNNEPPSASSMVSRDENEKEMSILFVSLKPDSKARQAPSVAY